LVKEKEYHFWNGKNVDGLSFVGDLSLLAENRDEDDAEMKYEVGCDTFSADDLQRGVHYD
jgi:hypothetical protein